MQLSDLSYVCFYFPSGFYVVDFIQMHCFHSSLDTILSIYSLGAARETLRLHSRELFLLLLFTCLFNSGATFFFFFFLNEMTYLASICEQRYSVLKFGQLFGFVHCSGTKTKKTSNLFFPNQPRTSSLHIIVKFELKIDLFWNISLFYRINAFIVFVQIWGF